MLAVLVLMIAAIMSLGVREARAVHCDSTVTAPDSIQDAIDAAGVGGVVCLDDSGGAFAQNVVFSGESDSFTTLTSAHGATPVLDGSSLGKETAIEVNAGAHNVTISNLQVLDFGHLGIRINGDFNQVIDVTSNGNVNDGIQLAGDDNVISGSTANGNGDDGIDIEPGHTRNEVSYSTANNNFSRGFHNDGHNNTVTQNTANDNGDSGFTFHGGDNTLSYNTANGNGIDGIKVSGGEADGNSIHHNNASFNLVNGILVSSDDNNIHDNTANGNGDIGMPTEERHRHATGDQHGHREGAPPVPEGVAEPAPDERAGDVSER